MSSSVGARPYSLTSYASMNLGAGCPGAVRKDEIRLVFADLAGDKRPSPQKRSASDSVFHCHVYLSLLLNCGTDHVRMYSTFRTVGVDCIIFTIPKDSESGIKNILY